MTPSKDTCAKCGHPEALHGKPNGDCRSITTCWPIPAQEWCQCSSYLARAPVENLADRREDGER